VSSDNFIPRKERFRNVSRPTHSSVSYSNCSGKFQSNVDRETLNSDGNDGKFRRSAAGRQTNERTGGRTIERTSVQTGKPSADPNDRRSRSQTNIAIAMQTEMLAQSAGTGPSLTITLTLILTLAKGPAVI
jgi:hypothetical protein